MNFNRRQFLGSALTLASATLLTSSSQAARGPRYTPVVTPNGSTMPWSWDKGVKVFRMVAEPVQREFAPGLIVNCWGYNGQTPGPTIEVVEGDRVRLIVTNKLPERTSVHWHGQLLPNGMDGVTGLTQPGIEPGETYVYEFVARQPGTLMYHPHADEMTQIAMGMVGFFIVHPRKPEVAVERDFCIFLGEWKIEPDTATPVAFEMTDFNYFTFNSKVYPGTTPLVVRRGQRVRVRIANLTMDEHPIHLHGHTFWITGTTGGRIPRAAQIPENTVSVPVGATRDFEFVADAAGDWPLHCHKTHHTMNGMEHDLPNMLGVNQRQTRAQELLPDIMPMGETGMEEMTEMQGGLLDAQGKPAKNPGPMGFPKNTIPMGATPGPYGLIGMGGMFTVVKVRDNIRSYADPGNYRAPTGSVSRRLDPPVRSKPGYTCPMHAEVQRDKPGNCPKCGMKLTPRP